MNVVDPSDKICLLLDKTNMPFRIVTARAAFYHLHKGHGQGVTTQGQVFVWDHILEDKVLISDDQPVMRSAHNVWAIPTIFIINSYFFKRMDKLKGRRKVSLRDLYYHYHGVCQYCGNKKHISQFSRDHFFPKSKGGSDDDFNLILSCKRCNSEKSDQFPYLNHEGKVVKPKGFYHSGFFLTHQPRKEWRPYLFLDDFSEEELEAHENFS